MRTGFALFTVGALNVLPCSRLADVCTGILHAFEDVSESHSQRLAPIVSVCSSRNALGMSGIGRQLFRDVIPAAE
ncbi:MAG: hypothetical protein QOD29_6235 [Alphaproteobacteria bacterium]|jgi:hypothetical protein|nr:hypothetical protein [Alphaproteobacteria bacterium]